MRQRVVSAGGLALALVAAGGCGLMKRAEVHTYELSVAPGAAPASGPGAAATAWAPPALPVGIGTVKLPPGLDRRELVVRTAGHQLDVRGTELWSAPLETLVLHTLAFDLAQRLPPGAVVLPGQVQPAGGQRSLELVFVELAAGPEPVLLADVHWTLRAAPAGPPERAGHERLSEPLDSLAGGAIAAGTSRALGRLADRLAAEVAAAAAVAAEPAGG